MASRKHACIILTPLNPTFIYKTGIQRAFFLISSFHYENMSNFSSFAEYFQCISTFRRGQFTYSFVKCGCSINFFLNSAVDTSRYGYLQVFRRVLPVSILRKSISGRHRPVRVADGPMTARCRFT